ncbi:MAG: hypothetical protein AAF841_07965 [Pseudomonadota bacterium]
MTQAILSLPAASRLPWRALTLCTAVLLAALYITGRATGLAQMLSASVIGLPLLGLMALLPTLLALGAVAWLAFRFSGAFAALALALLPPVGWSFVYAPLKTAQLLAEVEGDGGAVPAFSPADIVAVLDGVSPRHLSKSHCLATCMELLRQGDLRAIFLPRSISPDGNDVRGVIYRPSGFGRTCDRELTARNVRPLCVSMTPGSLWDVTHVFESAPLPAGVPGGLGVTGGGQMRLIHRYSGERVFQESWYEARLPSRLPIFGDLHFKADGSAAFEARMRTRVMTHGAPPVPLMTVLHQTLERNALARARATMP